MRGLMIRSPWIEKILDGSKTWEIRGKKTAMRGTIALIKSGSKHVYGTADLVNVKGPLSKEELLKTQSKHRIPKEELQLGTPYRKTYAWVMQNPHTFKTPAPYRHPSGAVIWVKLPGSIGKWKQSSRQSH